jgi:uncharacterized protein Smg (DUF494 family)
MTTKIVEALAKILEGLKNNSSYEDLSKSLTNSKEFDQKTISIAFSLIFDKILSKKNNKVKKNKNKKENTRVFTEEEVYLLGIENADYLMHLINVELIDNTDLEMILDQMSMFPEHLFTKNDINWFILLSLVNFDQEMLPGSRVLLFTSDTIN